MNPRIEILSTLWAKIEQRLDGGSIPRHFQTWSTLTIQLSAEEIQALKEIVIQQAHQELRPTQPWRWMVRQLDFESPDDCEAVEALLAARLHNICLGTVLYGVFAEEDALVGILGGAANPHILVAGVAGAVVKEEEDG